MLLTNNHLGNIFAEVITIKTLFALAKPSTIADWWGESWGLHELKKVVTIFDHVQPKIIGSTFSFICTSMQKISLFHVFTFEIESILHFHDQTGHAHFWWYPRRKSLINLYQHGLYILIFISNVFFQLSLHVP